MLFSFCGPCEVLHPYHDPQHNRLFGDFDKCPKCGETMDLWTQAGVRAENNRRWFEGLPALVETPPRSL